MPTYAEVIQEALAARDDRRAMKATNSLFATVPPKKAVEEFCDTTRNYSVDVLGYVLFPPVLEHLRRNDELFQHMIALASREDLPDGFRVVLLDYLQGAAYTRSDREPYWAAMRALAASPSQHKRVRAQAARNLGQDPSAATEPLIQSLIDSGEPTLVEAAASAARLRHLAKKGRSDKAADRLADYARGNTEHARRSPSVLSALATIGTPAAHVALSSLADAPGTDDELALLITAAGHVLDDAKLAQIVRRTRDREQPQSEASLQGLFAQHPRRLQALAEAGHHDEYLRAATLAIASGETPALDGLEKIAASKDTHMADRIRRIAELASAEKLPASIRKQKTEIKLGEQSVTADQLFEAAQNVSPPPEKGEAKTATTSGLQTGGWPRAASPAFSTGFHVGCSINSDLDWSNSGVVANHWHTGMFLDFVPYWNGTGGTMNGTHAAQLFDTVMRFSASASFALPTADLSLSLASLRSSFIGVFCNGGNFQGAHTVPGIATPTLGGRYSDRESTTRSGVSSTHCGNTLGPAKSTRSPASAATASSNTATTETGSACATARIRTSGTSAAPAPTISRTTTGFTRMLMTPVNCAPAFRRGSARDMASTPHSCG